MHYPSRYYTKVLEVALPDGQRTYAYLHLEPTSWPSKSSSAFWSKLLLSLVNRDPISKWMQDVDSLRGGVQQNLPFYESPSSIRSK